MAIRFFEHINEEDTFFGGKAWGLGRLTRLGFPVPRGLVLSSYPSDDEWREILLWWNELGKCPLAVRSSAGSEDSKEHSFAGQNQSFLNQNTEAELRAAVLRCFESIHRASSQAYREFFGEHEGAGAMNVVLQRMIDPKFAGVFFSFDPRGTLDSGWILEVIEGLGEDLVSGKMTPGRVSEKGVQHALPQNFDSKFIQMISESGLKARERLGFEVDLEWAIDQTGEFHVLQARPITTFKKPTNDSLIQAELARLNQNYAKETVFDGQTFSECAGLPSYFTYSLWREVFSPKHAFGDALKLLGYESFSQKDDPNHSLLDRVMGRAYLNLTEVSDLYYGPIPFSIVPKPRPHTVFNVQKLNFKTLVHFPRAILCMLRVGWNLSTKRKEWLNQCRKELASFTQRSSGPLDAQVYEQMTFQGLQIKLKERSEFFTKQALTWPLVLVVLVESTLQRLRMILVSVFGEAGADEKIRDFMAHGLHTVTLEMEKAYSQALINPTERPFFIARFGHRGPGEMDLKNPRWFELGDKAWIGSTERRLRADPSDQVESEILAYASYKRVVILEEWKLLKQMLELREQWKMEILKPYAEIRLILLEISKRKNLKNAIHTLRLKEVLTDLQAEGPIDVALWNEISERQEKAQAFKSYSFPEVVTLLEMNALLSGAPVKSEFGSVGEPLSPGLSRGEVRVVRDPTHVDLSTWPEKVILVAETTDPGWTPLFARASAILVEKGGVLSHCAIVAREMGIPAVSGLSQATHQFKDGDIITVDGNHGKVYL